MKKAPRGCFLDWPTFPEDKWPREKKDEEIKNVVIFVF
jgi:hypothetical protein